MSTLELEILRRNARLRAWRAFGVPVEGDGWRIEIEVSEYGSLPLAWLHLRCGVCRSQDERGTADPTYLDAVLREAIAELDDDGCPHLAPLLTDSDPPEVRAIYELELLAGA